VSRLEKAPINLANDLVAEAAALKVASEAAALGVAVESVHLGQAELGDTGGCLKLVQVGVGERLVGEVGIDPLLAKLLLEEASSPRRELLPGLDPAAGEIGIVEIAELAESLDDLIDD